MNIAVIFGIFMLSPIGICFLAFLFLRKGTPVSRRLGRSLRASGQWGNASAGQYVDRFCDECQREQIDGYDDTMTERQRKEGNGR
jgi:hypothetical protein